MARIKPLERVSVKWARNAGAAQQAYTEGVRGRGGDWESAASAAESAYSQGVQAAIGRGAFSAGVRRAGGGKWEQKTTTVGVERYPSGVAAAEAAYREGFQPYHQVIAGVSLPPKGPKGAAGNLERVRAITQALRQAKIARG
jgi:hypothetical protein